MIEHLEDILIIMWALVLVQVFVCGFKITLTNTKKNTSKVLFEIKSLSERFK